LTDIVSGGRIHAGNGRKGGVIWIKAPADEALRRDLSKWTIYTIDPDQYDAHGLILSDIDQDGDKDIVLANSDFDTPPEEEAVLWYENPGTGSPRQKEPWEKQIVYKGSEFHTKPQVVPADLDSDGFTDLIVQTENDIYFFRKTGVSPVAWDRIVISKDPAARFLARTLKVADINQDGRQDIIGMLVHKDGTLPGCKAAVFWMEFSDSSPSGGNWTTHVIKWGSGRTMIVPEFGEKWDQADIRDIDSDGDLDIVANCEEWWEDGWGIAPFWSETASPACIAVAWFENRTNEQDYAFNEKDGRCVVEAEQNTAMGDGTWVQRNVLPGFSGNGYVQDFNAIFPAARSWNSSVGASYEVNLEGGNYDIWIRGLAPNVWGWMPAMLGKSRSASAWLGIDGRPVEEGLENMAPEYDVWTWIKASRNIYLSSGDHKVELRVREGGFAVDSICLTRTVN
jgi:hypothetical protein